jgi:lipopolysaccharide export system protein LptA
MRVRTIFILFLLLIQYSVFATPVHLHHADELIGMQDEVLNTRTLVGNVELQQGNVIVKCDRAVQYLTTNRFHLLGNVVITQDTLVLKSNAILFDGNSGIATSDIPVAIYDGNKVLYGGCGQYNTRDYVATFGNSVVLEDDSLMVFADSLVYARKSTDSRAFGDVLVIDKVSEDVPILTSDSLNYNVNSKRVVAYSNPSISMLEQYIVADTIIATDTNYNFIGNLNFISDDLDATAEHGIYAASQITLYDNPHLVIQDADLYCTDSTIVSLVDNKPNSVHSYTDCLINMRADSLSDRLNKLFGDEIVLHIEQDTLRTIVSTGNAKCNYYNYNGGAPDGMVESTAAKIVIDMVDGKPEHIRLINNVPGKYFPEPLLNER